MHANDEELYIDSLEDQFDKIYVCYFPRMLRFTKVYVIYEEDAKNIVQDVFLMLWEKRRVLNVRISLTGYLFSLVKNKCIDYLRHQMIANEYKEELSIKLSSLEELPQTFTSEESIEKYVNEAIGKLPPRCREVFIKSRIDGKTYNQIANELQISIHTVENQIVLALKKLRVELKDCLPLLHFL